MKRCNLRHCHVCKACPIRETAAASLKGVLGNENFAEKGLHHGHGTAFRLAVQGKQYQAMKRPLSTSKLPVPTEGSWTS